MNHKVLILLGVRKLLWGIFILYTVFASLDARSSHISGMNVTYECLSGNNYLVSVNVFRDCYEIQELPTSLNVFIRSTCLTIGFAEFPLISLEEVSQLCAAELPNSTCNGGNQPGTQLGLYQFELELEPCIDWQIIVAEQNRDEAISNLIDPESSRIHVEAFLNNASNICNNAPQQTVVNLPYVCVGSPLFYNLGFVDADGDSLVYSFVPALSSLTPITPYEITYAGAYTGEEPMTGITINSETGQIDVTPNLIGKFNAVVRVEEYRDGVKIGEVRYDFLFLVNACAIPPPAPVPDSFENMSGGAYPVGENLIGICAEDDFCFRIDFASADAMVNVELFSNIAALIPGATETQLGTNPASIEICGSIPPGFEGGSFLITALDDACPVYGQAYYAMEFVFRQPLEAFGGGVFCEGVVADVFANNDTSYTWTHPTGDLLIPGSEASCNPCQTTGIVADTTAWYSVIGEYANSTCSNIDSVFVEVPLDMNITTSNETCNGDDGLIDIELLSGSTNLDVTWSDIGPGPLTRGDLVEGDYQVLIIDDDYGCSKLLSFTVIRMTVPTANAGDDIDVCGFATNLGAIPSSGVREWTAISEGVFGDVTAETSLVTVGSPGSYEFIWTENSGGGCVDSDTVQVTFYEMPNISIATVDSVCGLETDAIVNVDNGSFEWSGSATVLFSNPLNNEVQIGLSQYGISTLFVDAVNGACNESASHEVRFIEIPQTTGAANFSVCDDQTSVNGFESVGTGVWALPSGISSPDALTSETIGLEANAYGTYELIRYSENLGFCFDSDTVEVIFVEQPIVELEEDLVACDNAVSTNFTLPVGDLIWELPAELNAIATVETPTFLQGDYGTHTVVLHSDNGYGCIDSDTIIITLIEQPIAATILADTVCGLSTNLVAEGTADLTYWTEPEDAIVLNLSNPNSVTDVSVEGDYSFGWVLENGGVCRDTAYHVVTFYDQPIADAGADQILCGLTTILEAEPTFGSVAWSSDDGLSFTDAGSNSSEVTADWYGVYALEMLALNGICQSSDEIEITFLSQPTISNESWTCTGADSEFILSFELAHGDSSFHTVSGLAGSVEDYLFTSDPILSETPIEVIFYDDGSCGGDTISETWFCPVITNAGEMSPDTIHFCNAVLAESEVAELFSLDLNDTLLYALHTANGSELGDVLAWNESPSFAFDNTYNFETVYFISAVVGNATTDGVLLTDPFLSVSLGTPIVFHENPSAAISGTYASCPYEVVSIPITFEGSFPQTLSYYFNDVEITQTVLGPDFEIQAPDSGSYVLLNTSTDQCPGTVTGSAHVSYYGIPEASIIGPNTICFGESASLEILPQGNGPFDFDLALDGVVVESFNDVFNGNFVANDEGLFQVVNLTDANCGQQDTAAFFLLVKPLPIVDAGSDINGCSGDTVLIGTSQVFGQIYTWEAQEELLSIVDAQVGFTAINNGPFGEDYTLVLAVELNGCFDQDTVMVNVFSDPTPQLVGGTQLCRGDSLSLIGFGGEVAWSPSQYFSDTTATQTFFTALNNSEITLTVTSEFGCSASIDAQIEVLDTPNALFSISEHSGCAPLQVEFDALFQGSEYEYSWDIGHMETDESDGKTVVNFTQSGSYAAALMITAANGCFHIYESEESIEVFDTHAAFSFDANDLNLSNPDVYFVNESPANVTSFWIIDSLATANSRNLYYNFPNVEGYEYNVCLRVTSSEGCIAETCDDVFIKDDFFIYVPNSFTPNGDGLNDLFYPVLSFEDVKEYHFWISDTKGRKIFDTTDPGQKWNGGVDNSDYYGQGTSYIWHLVVKPDFNVETQYYSGHVIAVR